MLDSETRPAATALGELLRNGERALEADGDLRAGREWFDRAYRAAEAGCDGPGMARAALGLAGLWVHEHRSAPAAALLQARLRGARTAVDPGSSLALRLKARLAGEADYVAGESNEILAVLEEAKRAGDPVAWAESASLAHHCLLGPDHGGQRRALAQELITEGFRTDRRSDLLMGMLWRTVDLFLDGDPHAQRGLADLRGLLAERDHLAVGFVLDAIDVMLTIRAGRFEEAENRAAACALRGEQAGDADAIGWYTAQVGAVRWYQGRVAELLPMLRETVHSPTLSAVDNALIAGLAVAAAAAGDEREAAGALARLRGRDLALLPRSSSWLVSMYGIVESAYLIADVESARAAYALLTPFARLPMTASLGVACFGSVQHALGVAMLTVGEPGRAAEHFRAAVRDNLALAHWPAAALSRARLAQALGPASAEAARELAAATREAGQLGMVLPGFATGGGNRRVTCRRQGGHWLFVLDGRSALVEHSVGMGYLATLLDNPGHELTAVELAHGVVAEATSAQPVLDREATAHYRRWLANLEAELDEHEANHDAGRAEQVRTERDWLLGELSAAAGLAGRVREFAGAEEKARIAVGKAIRRALTRIAAADAVIGGVLRDGVHTGTRCSYRPT
ncbi:hypothetical protein SAMN05421837_10227 [Amycolatopsis pretoriensis]|uniref:Uncharacterized protein n=1 Tax=Amycolatopsis pretoriensis TaxID=218821 RepID=A0A1H5QD12_9PSEU|nr:hypothetical protein [Amycolatopsis pretoriensis]SEF23137.1 hypothetical protein SAMN05421837_10227 [Amycolatopsis pretoriensis]